MSVPLILDPAPILALNLAGTFVFGLSGGVAAVKAKLDLLGVLVLAGVVALSGGILRDLLIGVPPATFRDWRYLAAAAAAGLACFFGFTLLQRVHRSVLVFDALGLGLVAVTGASKALQFGMGPVQAILLGMVTGSAAASSATCCCGRCRPCCGRASTRSRRCSAPRCS